MELLYILQLRAIAHLIKHGADVNQKLDEVYSPDFTPVLVAAYEGHDDIVEFLLENDAEKDIYLAAILGDLDAIKKYVEAGSDVNISRQKGTDKPYLGGQSLLHLAMWRDSLEIVGFLIENGSNIDFRDKNGRTPLHEAAFFNSQNSVSLLIERGIDINSIDRKQETPLHNSVRTNCPDMIKLLIAVGANINAQNSYDNTPLHLAIRQDRVEAAKTLLDSGAATNIPNGAGFTPFALTRFTGRSTEMIDLLQSYNTG